MFTFRFYIYIYSIAFANGRRLRIIWHIAKSLQNMIANISA